LLVNGRVGRPRRQNKYLKEQWWCFWCQTQMDRLVAAGLDRARVEAFVASNGEETDTQRLCTLFLREQWANAPHGAPTRELLHMYGVREDVSAELAARFDALPPREDGEPHLLINWLKDHLASALRVNNSLLPVFPRGVSAQELSRLIHRRLIRPRCQNPSYPGLFYNTCE
jgi:hypothetical protein